MNKSLKVRVKRSGLVKLRCFRDLPDGNLFIAEGLKDIPFDIKRVYFINNLANPKALRGKHAHKALEQVLFCISGSFVLHLDDGLLTQRIRLDDPAVGIRLGPRLWHAMSSFSYDCVILVLASDRFDESDYIRDYNAFISFVQNHDSGITR
jgi:WxcM-like, C-terminal